MHAPLALPRVHSRQPLAQVALAAIGGILLADGVRRLLPERDDGTLAWVAAACFLALAALAARWRPGAWTFGALVASGYAALHFFQSDPLPAAVLAHALATPPDHVMRVSGTVLDVPRVTAAPDDAPSAAGGVNRKFLVGLAGIELDGTQRWDSHATVAVEWRDGPAALDPGDGLELVARAANVAPPRNPGEFDYADFLRRRGVRSELKLRGLADGRITHRGGPFQPLTLARGVHDWMQNQLCLDLRDEPEVCALVSTMLLGLRDRPGLGSLEPMFQRTGTLHFFAIDGLKLGLLAFLLLRALNAAGLSRPWAGLCILPLLLGYAMATGLGAASARAVLVAAVLVGGEWLDRPARPMNSLGAAASGLLLFDTNQLFELSFQLSFAVVLAILTLARPIDERLKRRVGLIDGEPDFDDPPPWPRRAGRFLLRQTCGLTAVAVAAWLGSMPLMLLDFHLVSPISPLANVLAFPLAFAVLALGVFSLAGASVSRVWVMWMNNANFLPAKLLLLVVRACDAVPGGSVAVAAPEHWHPFERPVVEMVVLDVGEARAGLVSAGPEDWLIDCARPFDYVSRVRPCLAARAVKRLDGLLLTQDDRDHVGAVAACRDDFSPARVVLPATNPRPGVARDMRLQLIREGMQTLLAHRGEVIPLALDVNARVLYPPEGQSSKGTAADRALALRFEAMGWRVWWLAEGDGAAERWLLQHGGADALDGDVLVTTAPVSEEWLQAVHPRLVVIRPPARRQKKDDPGAPLPTETTMAQTDCGAVTIKVYPDRLEARSFMDGRQIMVRK